MNDPEKLWLGGRAFRYSTKMLVRQDLWCMMHARHAGLVGMARQEGETPDEFMRRLMDGLLSSGRALLLLGGLLIPDSAEVWTEEEAAETAEFLGGISDPHEKQKLYVELASALLAFFKKGLGSWIGSESSSPRSAEEKRATNETSPSESGTASSATSQDTTPESSAKFSGSI